MEEKEQFDKTIPLYPFNGRSSNLIDKFYIIGYNYPTLNKFLIEQNPKISKEKVDVNGLGYFQLGLDPSILSEIAFDNKKQIVELDTIKKFIFPNNLFLYYRVEDVDNKSSSKKGVKNRNDSEVDPPPFPIVDLSEDNIGCPVSFRSVFSSYPDVGNNSKKCQNGFAYTFYRKFSEKKTIENVSFIFYIPYTFCIISEFPYFKSYEKLFRCIRRMFSQENIYIPIEILIYQIIQSTPSPINSDVIIDLDLMVKQNKLILINQEEINIDKEDQPENIININNKEIEKINPDDNIIKQQQPQQQSMIFNPYVNIIKFKYLSGYPLVQYNMAKVLFHKLSVEKIIKIFLFTFLEQNVIFFSRDVEYLTFTINAFMNLNFPLNDTHYFYDIGAICLEDFQNNYMFGIKNFSSIIAINNPFTEDYLSNINKINEHVIVDLDNGEILTRIEKENKKYDYIIKYVQNICVDKCYSNYTKGTKLFNAINNLNTRLNEIFQEKELFSSKEFIYYNDEPYKGSIEQLNQSIQVAFYECVIILSLYYYENISFNEKEINYYDKKDEKNKDFIELEFNKYYATNKYQEEENQILDILKESMKFESSFNQFFIINKPIDLYKIPMSFFEEFLSFFTFKKNSNVPQNLNYFESIDKLYLSKKAAEKKEIDFASDLSKYLNKYKTQIDQKINENDDNNIIDDFSVLIKVSEYQGKKVLKYQSYELGDKILSEYISLISNSAENKNLELILDNNDIVKGNKIKAINISEIEKAIDSFLLDNKLLSNNTQCCGNLILLFSMNLKYFPDNFNCDKYLIFLFQNYVLFRRHVILFLQMLYKLYKQSIEKKKSKFTKKIKSLFFSCFKYIKEIYLIPNEILKGIINEFLGSFLEEKNEIIFNELNNNINNNLNENDIIYKLTNNNPHISHNFSTTQFYKENYIVELINLKQKQNLVVTLDQNKIVMTPKIVFVISDKEKIESSFMCQKDVYNILINEYDKFNENMDIKQFNKKNILDCCLNIYLYIRQNDLLKYLDNIQIIENIFNIFIKNN